MTPLLYEAGPVLVRVFLTDNQVVCRVGYLERRISYCETLLEWAHGVNCGITESKMPKEQFPDIKIKADDLEQL